MNRRSFLGALISSTALLSPRLALANIRGCGLVDIVGQTFGKLYNGVSNGVIGGITVGGLAAIAGAAAPVALLGFAVGAIGYGYAPSLLQANRHNMDRLSRAIEAF